MNRRMGLLSRHSTLDTRHSATTLVELLVTMSVVSVLMLGGVGVYWRMNRGFALQAATSSIESALRAARHFAVHERSPAMVVAERRADNPAQVGLVYALGRQTVSCWHFEASQFAGTKLQGMGALGQVGTLPVAATFAPGRVGDALALNGTSTRVEVTSPYLDGLREGVFIECYVCPQAAASGTVMPIVSKGEGAAATFWLRLAATGTNIFALRGGVQVDGGGTVPPLDTGPLVAAGEWSHVALAYYLDGRAASGNARCTLILRINGEEAARSSSEGASLVLAPSTAPLHIGFDGTNYFKGLIDELKIAGLVAGEVYNLPKNTEVTLDAGGSPDNRVHFDREGKLDITHHNRPVLFRVISEEDRLLRVVRVNWLGAVEVFDGEPPAE